MESSHRLRRRLLHRLARFEPSQADLGIFLRVGLAEALTDPYDNGARWRRRRACSLP
ncbi:hypothetical protein NKH18_05135 [Streptomyces sp. M10(2022)]